MALTTADSMGGEIGHLVSGIAKKIFLSQVLFKANELLFNERDIKYTIAMMVGISFLSLFCFPPLFGVSVNW